MTVAAANGRTAMPEPTVIARLSHAAGLNLDGYRAEHVDERIRRALVREDVADPVALVRLIASDAAARSRFRRSIAVSVSGLFRDPAQFEHLEHDVLPGLVAGGRRVSVWSAGCADGSELYSVALILERFAALERSVLLGSDLLSENLVRARAGEYPGQSISPTVRGRVRWEQRDLLGDGAAPGRWRLVVCRNVAIYFSRPARQRLYDTLAGALAPGGVLLLGRTERLARPETHGLEPIAPHTYRRLA